MLPTNLSAEAARAMRATRVYVIGSGAVTPSRAALNCQKQPGPSPTGSASCDGNARSENSAALVPFGSHYGARERPCVRCQAAKQPVCPAGGEIDRIGAASGFGVGVARDQPKQVGIVIAFPALSNRCPRD
jgi:hypothetical protein